MDFDRTAFQSVASLTINSDRSGVAIDILDVELAQLAGVVYICLSAEGDLLRVGTTKHGVGSRLRQYPRHINRALIGEKSPTPIWEARQWLAHVDDGLLTFAVHQPPLVESVVGLIRPYLDIEREMILKFRPAMNRSHR
jgi:hypothetical protein